MNFIIFEDENFNNFYPISLTKPVWELRSGCFLQRERIEYFFNNYFSKNSNNFFYFTRDYLAPFFKEKYPDLKINDYSFIDSVDLNEKLFFINSVIAPEMNTNKNIFTNGDKEKNILFNNNDIPLYGILEASKIKKNEQSNIIDIIYNSFEKKKEIKPSLKKIEYIWDLININSEMIISDYETIINKNSSMVDSHVSIVGEEKNLYIEDNVKIDPFVNIDVTRGPVIIREGSIINSFTNIEGPCSIGRHCILLGAKIREGCSFGDQCRIGGEIEESIIHSHSNKYHDGFLGHAYIGEWVNLGAMTTNSDLKNNYSHALVYIPEKRVNTKSMKAGCYIGDFTKTSIGTLLTTGASIGVGAMLLHAGKLSPYHVPSFSWLIDNTPKDYKIFKDFIETCKVQTSRRNIKFSEIHEELLKYVYKITADDRGKEVKKWKKKQK